MRRREDAAAPHPLPSDSSDVPESDGSPDRDELPDSDDALPDSDDPLPESADALPESVSQSRSAAPVSPVRARAADQTVKRATSGLMRLDSRRRMRTILRRSIYLALLAAPIAALIYFFAEDIVDVLVAYWERIQAKLPAAEATEVPRR